MSTYSITRHYFNKENKTTQTGLTLEEAREHCNDPETSSHTASDPCESGRWFDGYEEE